jgi:adenylate cyclase
MWLWRSMRSGNVVCSSSSLREALRRPIYALGGERRIAVLFADLRDFTRITETKLPYDVVFLLNRYCQVMGESIETAGGRIDKFIGDGVMALFGLETDAPDACRQALTAARLMSLQLVELNRILAPDLDAPLRMGLGVHFGAAIVGEIGSGGMRPLTAVGDTVNTASRLESLCKLYDCELVVSEDLVVCAAVHLKGAHRREVEIRGRTQPLMIRTLKSARELPGELESWLVDEPAVTVGRRA